MNRERLVRIARNTASGWIDDNAFRMSAALAFYTVFSLAPLVLIAVAVAGLVLGRQAAAHQLSAQFQTLIGPAGAQTVEQLLAQAYHPHSGIIATVVSIVTLIAGAIAVVGELQDALNGIWRVKNRPGRAIVRLLRDRVFSFGIVVSIGFVMLVSLVMGAAISAVGGVATQFVPHAFSSLALSVIHTAVSLVVSGALFGLMFKTLPDVDLRWRDVLVGSGVTAAFFAIGRVLIGLYLGRAGVGSPFGAAGSLVVLLVWVYYSSLIMYLGAEFTRAWTLEVRGEVHANSLAVPIDDPRVRPGPERDAQFQT